MFDDETDVNEFTNAVMDIAIVLAIVGCVVVASGVLVWALT